MKMRNFWAFIGITIIAIVLALVIWSYANAYDKTKPEKDIKPSNTSCFTYVRVKVVGTAMGMYYNMAESSWGIRETLFVQQGSGYVVKDGFILTAAHVITPDKVETQSGKWSVHITKPMKILTRIILIYDYKDVSIIAKIHYINSELDIAILKYKSNKILKSGGYEIEYGQQMLKQDDVVFSFLHTRNENGFMTDNLKLRYGIVLSNKPTVPKMDSSLAWFNEYDITLQMEIQAGDSGSPLFALRDGIPILIGIIRATYNDGIVSLGYAVTLPRIRRYLNIK